jgi:23S rRNA (cytosine1962-C5)-methyltransferase
MKASGYELWDTGNGQRLERLGAYWIVRPEPTATWEPRDPQHPGWLSPDARYHTPAGWETTVPQLRDPLAVTLAGQTLYAELTPFKHLAFFPEQMNQWQRIAALDLKEKHALNLFSYTGAATVAMAQAGASVVHVDASKKSVARARENLSLNHLADCPVRWIVDDVRKFVAREVRRGSKYDFVMLDPPVFGRGVKGEVWRIEQDLWELLVDIGKIISPNAHLLINTYATSLYPHIVVRMTEEAGITRQLAKQLVAAPVLLHQTTGGVLQTGFEISTLV